MEGCRAQLTVREERVAQAQARRTADGQPLHPDRVTDLVKRTLVRHALTNPNLHDLRHFWTLNARSPFYRRSNCLAITIRCTWFVPS
jgi:hypothetical protein